MHAGTRPFPDATSFGLPYQSEKKQLMSFLFKYHFCYLLLSLNWNCWHLLFHIQTSELSYFRSLTTAGFGCTRQTQMITDFYKAKPKLFHKHQVPVMMMILLTSNTGMIVFLIDCSNKHGHIFRPVKSSVPYPSWTLHSWLHDFHLHHSGGVLRSQNFTMTSNEKKHDKTVGTHLLLVLRCIMALCIIYYQHLKTKSRQLRSQVVEASNGGGTIPESCVEPSEGIVKWSYWS